MDAGSSFAERYLYSRDHQAADGRGEDDVAFAKAIGAGSSSALSEYKKRPTPPPFDRVLRVALRCGVDPGWLAFGGLSQAPAPEKFGQWLSNWRAKHKPVATKRAHGKRIEVGRKRATGGA